MEGNGNRRPDNNLPHEAGEEQGGFLQLGLSIKSLATISTLIQLLVNFVQARYQINSNSSPFETTQYQTIMYLIMGFLSVHFLALMELHRPNIPNDAIYRHIASLFCYISGVLACTCLVFIIFPAAFGWAIFLSPFIYFNQNNVQADQSSSPTVNDDNVSMDQQDQESGGEQQEAV